MNALNLDAAASPDSLFDDISAPDAHSPGGRAKELQQALRPLNAIKPVLSSRYLVKGWIDRGTTSVVYGQSNVGKTFFALDLAMHVAACVPWHGAKVSPATETSGCVVYIASEGGSGLHNRIEAIRRQRPDLVEKAERRRSFTLLQSVLDLCTSTDARELVRALDALPLSIDLVVIDTLARTMGDGDENTTRDMGAFVRSLDKIRTATGAHIMVIHHSGKDPSKGARGSGSLRAAVDTEIHLERKRNVTMAQITKQRDMPADKVFAYRLRGMEIGPDEDGEPVTSAVVVQTDPVKEGPKLSAQKNNALLALEDALKAKGEVRDGEPFPRNQPCVPVSVWHEFCDQRRLSNGDSESAQRKAFSVAKKALEEKNIVCISNDWVWRCKK
ncbi:AAA family ATPase [Aestuariivita boseongensis]|uniref:AAA family ATPase n=1 Tax=Aestuariivita boseongensis TaxID=1470562 RepID=UPI0006804A81|nr:helicase RepA family protein [Aestuariivita boseongensis]